MKIFPLLLAQSMVCQGTVGQPDRSLLSPLNSLGSLGSEIPPVFAFTANQAALARMDHFSVGVYGEQRFAIKELSAYHAAIFFPLRYGKFGVEAGYFGLSGYREMLAALCYGRKLHDKIDVGVGFNYYSIGAGVYGSASAFHFDVGAILHLKENLKAGFHVANPLRAELNKGSGEMLPGVYSFGLGYQAAPNVLVELGITKEEDKPVDFTGAVQYSIIDRLRIQTGVSSGSSNFFLAVGWHFKSIWLEAMTGYHQALGPTPALRLVFERKPDQSETSPGKTSMEK